MKIGQDPSINVKLREAKRKICKLVAKTNGREVLIKRGKKIRYFSSIVLDRNKPNLCNYRKSHYIDEYLVENRIKKSFKEFLFDDKVYRTKKEIIDFKKRTFNIVSFFFHKKNK